MKLPKSDEYASCTMCSEESYRCIIKRDKTINFSSCSRVNIDVICWITTPLFIVTYKERWLTRHYFWVLGMQMGVETWGPYWAWVKTILIHIEHVLKELYMVMYSKVQRNKVHSFLPSPCRYVLNKIYYISFWTIFFCNCIYFSSHKYIFCQYLPATVSEKLSI